MRKLAPIILFVGLLHSAPGAALDVWVSHQVNFTSAPGAARYDPVRSVIYVSIPGAKQIAVVDLHTYAVSKTIDTPGDMPRGLDLSADSETLYAALSQSGSVLVYKTQGETFSSVGIGTQLGSTYTWDIAETSPGVVFASAGEGDGGLSYIARLDLNTMTATRVANNQIIRASPIFGKDPTGNALYIGEGFFPNSLYKLDITQDLAPISMTAPFDSLVNIDISIAVSPDGQKLVLGGGEVVRASELTEDGYVGPGVAVYSKDGASIASAYGNAPLAIHRFDTARLDEMEIVPTSCNFENYLSPPEIPTAIVNLEPAGGWVVIAPNMVCITQRVPDEIFGGAFE
ncbi:hypothetical protein ELE36_07025 [Pseudolysobacter antarcticus]|uniref:YncE family protein n=1 Tax=Pseudolysobacter antarcticus TaxID=2511995 RepID=A0A411HIB1_9GAMM|nr:hypothetical protein [Pseudolysobacter antarcticus]QBB70137.1 hypothetical protein ELE36_07025 [Pseudolysobacter antarcticus]